MPGVESLDVRVVDHELLVNLERMEICDLMVAQSVVDVSRLLGRMFQPLIPEPASVIPVRVRDQHPGSLRDSPSGRRIKNEAKVWCVDEETVMPADSIFSHSSFPPAKSPVAESRPDGGRSLPSTLYLPPVESD